MPNLLTKSTNQANWVNNTLKKWSYEEEVLDITFSDMKPYKSYEH
jgi:hypothetical protein